MWCRWVFFLLSPLVFVSPYHCLGSPSGGTNETFLTVFFSHLPCLQCRRICSVSFYIQPCSKRKTFSWNFILNFAPVKEGRLICEGFLQWDADGHLDQSEAYKISPLVREYGPWHTQRQVNHSILATLTAASYQMMLLFAHLKLSLAIASPQLQVCNYSILFNL